MQEKWKLNEGYTYDEKKHKPHLFQSMDNQNPDRSAEELTTDEEAIQMKMLAEIKEKFKNNDTSGFSFLPPHTPYIPNRFDHIKFDDIPKKSQNKDEL